MHESYKLSYVSEACLISVLWLVQASFSLYIYVTMYTQAALRVFKSLIGGRDPVTGLIELKEGLDKIPKHVAFILLEDCINYNAAASLIAWSLVVGIDNISVYDPAGELKRNQDKLLIELNEKLKDARLRTPPLALTWWSHSPAISTTTAQDSAVIVSKNGAMYPDVNGNGRIHISGGGGAGGGEIGGTGKPKSVNISLLSRADGKGDIVRCARTLSSQISKGDIAANAINEHVVSANLRSNHSLPDPSLAVRIGQLNCTADFLPWQLRLTEIHSISCSMALQVSQFTEVLKRYSRCEQRFGK